MPQTTTTPLNVVVDASVLVSAVKPDEPGYHAADRLLNWWVERQARLIVPAIAIPEVLGAAARNARRPLLGRQLLAEYRSRSNFVVIPVDVDLAESAGDIALSQHLKGCDAIYVALARRLKVPLVTLDREQRDRAPADVEVLLPDEALAMWFPS